MKSRIIVLFAMVALLIGCQTAKPTEEPKIKKGMIKVTVFYAGGEGKTFDMDYYINKHFRLLENLLGDSLKAVAIDKGLTGRTPDEPSPYVAIGYLYFDSVSAYQNSMAVHGKEIVADVANYTNIQPVIQISEVME